MRSTPGPEKSNDDQPLKPPKREKKKNNKEKDRANREEAQLIEKIPEKMPPDMERGERLGTARAIKTGGKTA